MKFVLFLSLLILFVSARDSLGKEKDEQPLDFSYPLRLTVVWNELGETRQSVYEALTNVTVGASDYLRKLSPSIEVYATLKHTGEREKDIRPLINKLRGTFDILVILIPGSGTSSLNNAKQVCSQAEDDQILAETFAHGRVDGRFGNEWRPAARELAKSIAAKLGVEKEDSSCGSGIVFSANNDNQLQKFIRSFNPGQFCLQNYQLNLKVLFVDGFTRQAKNNSLAALSSWLNETVANANRFLSTMQPMITVKLKGFTTTKLPGKIREDGLRSKIVEENGIDLYVVIKGQRKVERKLQKMLNDGRICDKFDLLKKTLIETTDKKLDMYQAGKRLAVGIAKKLGAAADSKCSKCSIIHDNNFLGCTSTALWNYIEKVKTSSTNGAFCLKNWPLKTG